jgi:HAD superfamily hydrolase (TIGR01484 family)
MRYKALIFDLDGTAIPAVKNALPSDNIIDSIGKAQRVVTVSAATGRSLPMVQAILNACKLKDPCILSGGTEIIDPLTNKIVWQVRLLENQVKQIVKVCLPYPYEVFFSDDIKGLPARDRKVSGSERIVYIKDCKMEDAKKIQKELKEIQNITSHFAGSWTPDRVDVHITHKDATKKHAVNELTKMLCVGKNEVIAVGDNNNDIPLFESAGFKVAMGNATDDLKRVADYIAPPVKKDGLAYVIQKFILDL